MIYEFSTVVQHDFFNCFFVESRDYFNEFLISI